MKKNTILEKIEITSLGYGGVGVAKAPNGKKILIRGALPESIVDVRIVKKKRDYLLAHITHVHSVDKKYLTGEIKCPHYLFPYAQKSPLPEHKSGCGGCKRQAVSYEKQLEMKQAMVHDSLAQYIDGVDQLLEQIVPSPLQFGYRNKIEFSFGKYLVREPKTGDKDVDATRGFAKEEHWQAGFHKQGQFSKVIDVDQCYLVSPRMHEVYNKVKTDLMASGLPVYDAKQHEGFLRHLVLREGVHTDHIMLNLSCATELLTQHAHFAKIWKELLKRRNTEERYQNHITTFVITHNNGLADIVHGRDSHIEIIWGEGRIYEELRYQNEDGESKSNDTRVRFAISPYSFFQTNTLGAEKLFQTAVQLVGDVSGNVIDLYCGGGSIGLTLLSLGLGKNVKGIDIVEDAIRDAHYNAKINGFSQRADFFAGKAEKLLLEGTIDSNFFVGGDLVVIDPPREGLHPKVTEFLISLKKSFGYKLLYISCNPTTMARDIRMLNDSGEFSLHVVQPVDMFPHTHHIEVVSVLL